MDKAHKKIPVWLDCDPGHDPVLPDTILVFDSLLLRTRRHYVTQAHNVTWYENLSYIYQDSFAILILTHHPSFHLLGISTIYGNAPLYHTTHNALALLTAFSTPHIPVYAGASAPLGRDPISASTIHGLSGLDGSSLLPVPSVTARTDVPAIDAMASALLSQPKGMAWVVATGALTNIHLCFGKYKDRGLREHIKGLSIMGGAIGDGFTDAFMGFWTDTSGNRRLRMGNWSPWAEFNIVVDPEAAESLLRDEVLKKKTTMVPLDLTHLVIGTDQVRENMLWGGERREGRPRPLRKMMVELLDFFKETYSLVFGFPEGPPLHDPVAVAVLLEGLEEGEMLFWDHKDMTDGARCLYEVNVVREGEETGRTIVKLLPPAEAGVRISKGLNIDKFWSIIEECLEKADRASIEGGVFDRQLDGSH